MNHPRIFGICNFTPDSFSGDGILDPDLAAERVGLLFAQGADYVDIGAESTNPFKTEKPLDGCMELERLSPLMKRILPEYEGQISVDSYHPETIDALAREHGPVFIANDVTGLNNKRMREVIASHGLTVIFSHLPYEFGTDIQRAHDVARAREKDGNPSSPFFQTLREMSATYDSLVHEYGVDPSHIIADPGIGFGKTMEENWRHLQGADRIKHVLPGVRVMIGASHKRFLATDDVHDLGSPIFEPKVRYQKERNIYAARLALKNGADMLRVHEPEWYGRLVQDFAKH